MKRAGLFIIACSLFLGGCNNYTTIRTSLEEFSLISTVAVDYVDENTMEVTMIIPQSAHDATKQSQIYTIQAPLLSEAFIKVGQQNDKTIKLSQMRVFLFSEEFAQKENIKKVLKTLYRDARIRSNLHIGVVKGRAADILQAPYEDKANNSSYLNSLMEPKSYSAVAPFTTLHQFLVDETGKIRDPFVPVVSLENGNAMINHGALFDDNHFVKEISEEKAKIIQAMRGVKQLTPIAFDLADGEKAILDMIVADGKVHTSGTMQSPEVQVEFQLQGLLTEYRGKKNLDDQKQFNQLEREISKHLEKEFDEIVAICKEENIDPVGFFEGYRMKYKGEWKREFIKEMMPVATFKVKAKTRILTTGVLK